MFELVYAFTCLDLQVYGGVLSRDAYETVGVTDDVRARLRARLRASARSSRIRRGRCNRMGTKRQKCRSGNLLLTTSVQLEDCKSARRA